MIGLVCFFPGIMSILRRPAPERLSYRKKTKPKFDEKIQETYILSSDEDGDANQRATVIEEEIQPMQLTPGDGNIFLKHILDTQQSVCISKYKLNLWLQNIRLVRLFKYVNAYCSENIPIFYIKLCWTDSSNCQRKKFSMFRWFIMEKETSNWSTMEIIHQMQT